MALHNHRVRREVLVLKIMEGLKLEDLTLFNRHLGAAQKSLSGEENIGDVVQSSQNKIKEHGSWVYLASTVY